jgi:nitroreductase
LKTRSDGYGNQTKIGDSGTTGNATTPIASGTPLALQICSLPQPRTHGGLPLLDALQRRHSTREYYNRPLPIALLSDLLWAAYGTNRSNAGDRTAPYWRQLMVIDVYVATADGVWLYSADQHELLPCLSEDIRSQTGIQYFISEAPLNLIYVANGERMHDVVLPEDRRLYASVDTAFIGQNVYLFCASEGLGTVFRSSFDPERIAKALKLQAGQFVTFVQTVGYPKPQSSNPE